MQGLKKQNAGCYGASENTVIQNLKDAGCDETLIASFMTAMENGREKEGLMLLTSHRRTLLDKVHMREKQIDCLDYLVYQMKKAENGGKL